MQPFSTFNLKTVKNAMSQTITKTGMSNLVKKYQEPVNTNLLRSCQTHVHMRGFLCAQLFKMIGTKQTNLLISMPLLKQENDDQSNLLLFKTK